MTKKKTPDRTKEEISGIAMTVLKSLGWRGVTSEGFNLKTDKLELSGREDSGKEYQPQPSSYLLVRDNRLVMGKHQVIIHRESWDKRLEMPSVFRYSPAKPDAQAELDMLHSMATRGIRTDDQRRLEEVLEVYRANDIADFESRERNREEHVGHVEEVQYEFAKDFSGLVRKPEPRENRSVRDKWW